MSEPLRAEYPRPDLRRAHWMTLNGTWAFALDPENRGRREKWYLREDLPLRIEVPFCYQSKLSGVDSQEHADAVWYRREFRIPQELRGGRVLLRFGAADYRTEVWLDGRLLGEHEGGYTPFAFDITDAIGEETAHVLTVRCEDRLDTWQPRGKQSYRPEPFACWYTPVTGIWQSVWLEAVGEVYPTELRVTPRLDLGQADVELMLNECPPETSVRFTVSFNGKRVLRQEVSASSRLLKTALHLGHDEEINGIHTWSPAHPDLYDLRVETLTGDCVSDCVDTYFGMREIQVEGNVIYLNHEKLVQRLILDQGYWPDGLLTAPSADALKRDVELTLAMGYNGARKHQKFEDPWYLYWADHLGLLVWEELPSGYWLCDQEKRNFHRDLSEAIRRDYNHPATVAWVPLNESWGVYGIRTNPEAQRLADSLYALAHCLDGTRPVSGNDGWEMAATDLVTIHDYTAWPEQLDRAYQDPDALLRGEGTWKAVSAAGYDHSEKPMLLSEFGGIAFARDAEGDNWGYNGAVQDEAAFLKRFGAITRAFREMPGFSGYCYTQLTDVFQEVNGLLDMDRNPKASVDAIRAINLGED